MLEDGDRLHAHASGRERLLGDAHAQQATTIEASPSLSQSRRIAVASSCTTVRFSSTVRDGNTSRSQGAGRPRMDCVCHLQECLAQGDKAVNKETMDLDDYAAYVEMNNRFHELLIEGCGNTALARTIEMLNGLPFAAASAMLPMQSSIDEGHESMQLAHRQHHALVQAMERGQGFRAQALCEEHVEIARMNLDFALERPDVAAQVLPGIGLVEDAGRVQRRA